MKDTGMNQVTETMTTTRVKLNIVGEDRTPKEYKESDVPYKREGEGVWYEIIVVE